MSKRVEKLFSQYINLTRQLNNNTYFVKKWDDLFSSGSYITDKRGMALLKSGKSLNKKIRKIQSLRKKILNKLDSCHPSQNIHNFFYKEKKESEKGNKLELNTDISL